MFPMSSALCAQQRLQYIGSTAARTDVSGNATLALPAGTSVGDLLLFHKNGSGGTVGGGGSGSWTAPGQVSYKKVVTLSSVTLTGGLSSSDSALLLVVVRGASALGTVGGGGSGGSYPNLTLAGVTKTNAGVGIVWFLASGANDDGASSWAITSPPGSVSSVRSGSGVTCVVAFVEPYPGSYVSGAVAAVTATGGAAGASYNTSESYELQ